jgi:ABC-2 type transport system ATP-binding protein
MSDGYAVRAEALEKRYGDKRALDGFDLAVREGTVHGLLGPNGAGKTTAVRILSTLLRLDGGRATVAGLDVVRQSRQVRARIGLTGQYAAVDEVLTGRQNLEMFGRLFHLGGKRAKARATELLEQFDLTDAAEKGVGKYSGGMRRRLDLAASMILAPAVLFDRKCAALSGGQRRRLDIAMALTHRPKVLFLDEPTTGLDPRSRGEVWDSVRALVASGTTVLLTTQYLEEADKLASRITVIDQGRAIADDTPDGLKNLVGGDRMSALTEVARTLQDEGVRVEDIGLRRPSLDDVFLRLTGHRTEKEAAA